MANPLRLASLAAVLFTACSSSQPEPSGVDAAVTVDAPTVPTSGSYTVTQSFTATGCKPPNTSITEAWTVTVNATTITFAPLASDEIDAQRSGTMFSGAVDSSRTANPNAMLHDHATITGHFTASTQFELADTIQTSCEGSGCPALATQAGIAFPCTNVLAVAGSQDE